MNDVEQLPMAEHSEWGMTEQPMSEDEERDLQERLEKECSVRDACGCKGVLPSVETFEMRMSTVNQTFERGGLSQNIEGVTADRCTEQGIEDLLSRYLHPQTLDEIKAGQTNGVVGRQGADAWTHVQSVCPEAPSSITEFYAKE